MKSISLGAILLLIGGIFIPYAHATLTSRSLCSREIPTFLEDEYLKGCTSTLLSAETIASKALEAEALLFQSEDLSPLLFDSGSNGHFIAQAGIQRLRFHESCLENICRNWWKNCSLANYGEHASEQFKWCNQKQKELSRVARSELFVVATKNQSRKDRSLLSEKFGQISTRFRYYLHYWINKTATNLQFWKGKIDTTIRNPR